MDVKLFELRDKGTFIPIFAFRARPTNEQERYLLARAGYGTHGQSKLVIVGRADCKLTDRSCTYDPYSWMDRTFATAHQYIQEHFDELPSGAVIDIEFILGETTEAKSSESTR